MATPSAPPNTVAATPVLPALPPTRPLVPESFFDAPSQRTYVLGLGGVLQALKAYELVRHYLPEGTKSSLQSMLWRWTLFDGLYICFVPMLRIPWLMYPNRSRFTFIFLMGVLNWLLMGNYTMPSTILVPTSIRDLFDYQLSISEHRIRVQDVVQSQSHLLGQHTVRLSPVSTAELNPYLYNYCFDPAQGSFSIPVLLNNTQPHSLRYCVTSLDSPGNTKCTEMGPHELKKLEVARRRRSADFDDDFDDDFADRQLVSSSGRALSPSQLESTQSIARIELKSAGVLRLDRILDSSNNEVRLFGGETTIVECPVARFYSEAGKGDLFKCLGDTEELTLEMRGVPPLSLKYWRDAGGKRELLSVDGIEGEHGGAGSRVSQATSIPLNISLTSPGKHSFVLDSITDGVGNIVSLAPSSPPARSQFAASNAFDLTVLKRPAVSWRSCSITSPAGLRQGDVTTLHMVMKAGEDEDGPWEVELDYKGPDGKRSDPLYPQATTVRNLKGASKQYPVGVPGDYRILSVKGSYCQGDVLSPETCRVVELPEPTIAIDMDAIKDRDCGVEVGLRAHLVMHGTPPFTVSYTTKRDNEPSQEFRKTFQSGRGEIVLQPDKPGTYAYAFTSLRDANYIWVPLYGPSREQVVHSLAGAELVQKPGGITLRSCSGDSVDVVVSLKGTPPWNLELQVVSPHNTQTVTKTGLMKSRETITIPLPDEVNNNGGQFLVDLVSVEDKAVCKRALNVPGVSVKVVRVKPTARFYSPDGLRELVTLEGEQVRLPIRLTGDGPWKLTYRDTVSDAVRHATLSSANDFITVKDRGSYELLEVRDAHCPGTIAEGESMFFISWTPRPIVGWAKGSGEEISGKPLIRQPVCEGREDHVDISFHGRPPFEVTYMHSSDGHRDETTFSSLRLSARIDLQTIQPGPHTYELTRLGDSAYPIGKVAAPGSAPLKLYQEVLRRPTASFKSDSRVPFCLHDNLVSRKRFSEEGIIVLQGTPPFVVDLSIRNTASSMTSKRTITITSHEWQVDLPDYHFDTIGPHVVKIESVKDASECAHASLDLGIRMFWIDVAETAAILPMERRTDYCVGETLQFQLEGTSPWRINYVFNGKKTAATSKTAKFSRIADVPGDFSITSISHQQNLCESKVDDLAAVIHALPSASVSQGQAVVENIREGDQAEIVFSLTGEPPFTFTYQRAELGGGKRGQHARVMETHTVTGIMDRSYTVVSALEGTWTVTFIADKFCRYPPAPPAPPEMAIENI